MVSEVPGSGGISSRQGLWDWQRLPEMAGESCGASLQPQSSRELERLPPPAFQSLQPVFEIEFMGIVGESQEVEHVRVFEQLPGEVRFLGRQRAGEVGDRLAGPGVGLRLDLHRQYRATPAVFDDLVGVPLAGGGVFDPCEQEDVLSPRNSSNKLLDN